MRKKLTALLLAAVLCVTALAGCAQNNQPGSGSEGGTSQSGNATGQTLSVNVGPEPNSIDPALNTAVDGGTMLVHTFEGLTKLDKEGKPQLAQAEKIELSDDKLTYTVTLRADVKWSDGQPVTAEDFVYSWRRVVNPDTAAEYAYMMEPVKNAAAITSGDVTDLSQLGIKAIDERTLEIQLEAVCTYFEELLAFPVYYPVRKDLVEGNDNWTRDPAAYVGNGPYKMVEWKHNEVIVMEKNPHYYGLSELVPQQIRFVLLEDDNAILNAYENGDIVLADSMPNAEIEAWKDKEDFQTTHQLGTYFIIFQTEKEPFNDPKVRKALSLSIDRNYLVDRITKIGENPASGFVPDTVFDADTSKKFREVGGSYWSVDQADYESNVAEAKKLLAEAGYPNGEGFPVVEYMYNPATPHLEVAESLIDMWKSQLGITVKAASQDWNVFIDTRRNGDYQIARHGWIADYNDPISFLDMWVTGSGNNNAMWSNSKYDELIKQARLSADRDERFRLMHQAEDILMEEMPVAPLFYVQDLYLKNPKLQGFYDSPLGFKYFMYASMAD